MPAAEKALSLSPLARWLPWLVFGAILLQGASIGLTDDEAYYWVLAQRPALGYAFHPPAVALCIAAAQGLLGWLVGHHCAGLVRLPAAACAAALVALGIRWLRRAGAADPGPGGLVLVSFGGLFALAWMIVPDLPLFVGWTLAFGATWELCFEETLSGAGLLARAGVLGGGVALAILSKYSGVLAAVSAFAAIGLWAPRERRIKALGALFAGVVLASLPILWWNSRHEWASLLYQLRERHGDAQVSLIRYLRFWAIELVLMGPALLVYGIGLAGRALKRRAPRQELYLLTWAMPGAVVFCLQPLWADFKPHWALIVWWPLVLGLGWARAQNGPSRLARIHVGYGLSLIALVWISCQLPLGSWAMSPWRVGALDPRLDVTNDLYGWSRLRADLIRSGGARALERAFVGSRYQTAAQAAFALGDGARVTLLPRDLKAMDEWPDLGVSDGQGPGWPRLLVPVVYVADNRYDAAPEYPGANCARAGSFESQRLGYVAKTIYLWNCEPRSGRP